MKVYLVRHGETDWNVQRRIQGFKDISINEKGIIQAKKAASFFKHISIDGLYTSGLKRTVETASHLFPDREPVKHDAFNERHFGEWQGKTKEEVYVEYPEYESLQFTSDFRPIGGESVNDVVERGIKQLQSVVQNHQYGENIVIVSHGGMIRGVLSEVMEYPREEVYSRYKIANCGITLLRYEEGKFHMEFLNSTV